MISRQRHQGVRVWCQFKTRHQSQTGAFVWSDNLPALGGHHVPSAWEWLAVIAESHFNWLQLAQRWPRAETICRKEAAKRRREGCGMWTLDTTLHLHFWANGSAWVTVARLCCQTSCLEGCEFRRIWTTRQQNRLPRQIFISLYINIYFYFVILTYQMEIKKKYCRFISVIQGVNSSSRVTGQAFCLQVAQSKPSLCQFSQPQPAVMHFGVSRNSCQNSLKIKSSAFI